MIKTLVILLGNPRGGEKTWNSMYENLLEPYDADLAICFGYNENKKESLYTKSKYVWEVPEYDEWADYYVENFGNGGIWKKVFALAGDNGFSGLYGSKGSSAITFALRDWILKNKGDVLLNYDRIIITRSDYFYYKKHPLLDNNYFWIPFGEGYGGITDRHHIFPSSDVDIVLGIVDNYINTNDIIEDFGDIPNINLNIEKSYIKYFGRIGYSKKIKQFERVQFTVKTLEDPTRWWPGPEDGKLLVPGHTDLYIKYGDEYALCENINAPTSPNCYENGEFIK
jgi:hypothetical protein